MRETITEDGRLRIRRLHDESGDYELMAGWLNQPHVKHFWDPDLPPATSAYVRTTHGPDTQPGAPTTACVIELDGRPVGFIQFYRWVDYADEARQLGVDFDEREWGLDVLIGEPDVVGVGVGSRAVELLCEHLEREREPSGVTLLTDITNTRAHRAYEKGGFVRVKEVLDLDTRDGERVRSYIMRRHR
ncbi:MAG: GNAT family N-acetyltransferase [Candidatus Dormibacteria bacterium]